MIKIFPPTIKEGKKECIIAAEFELEGRREELWYRLPNEYKPYIVTEQLDAFVIALLFLGLKTGQDIKLMAPISSRLFYSIKHYIIDALCLVNSAYTKIKIIPTTLSTLDFNTRGVAGTGLSCGIDSFASYYDHLDDEKPYKIEYFTFFNVGSHGDFGGEKARMIFKDRFENVQTFASEVGREVITIDSNLSEILGMKFQETYNLRTISCVLILQKLFKNYYYASGTRFDHFSFNKDEIADLDMLLIPNLSTESTSIFVSALKYSRIERTDLISRYSETYKYLDVCTHPFEKNRSYLNCSKCYKCKRTMLTLEALGKLDLYSGVFDVKRFRKEKYDYIGWLLSKEKKLTLDKELIIFLYSRNMINSKVHFYTIKNALFRQKMMLKKIFR
ncbi:hypothetical protein LB465_16395 [Salegentibacter sp. LM13S]|uniref:hypothetical protein n=1 Tax=Salegentibacter lacus TaxID=2873599 RepID=UPI001CC996F1|nr:hypothetical protein [Salegentibacter lacus]MBZ9632363.1 hypothetical protein [Salegentibacter lacus]